MLNQPPSTFGMPCENAVHPRALGVVPLLRMLDLLRHLDDVVCSGDGWWEQRNMCATHCEWRHRPGELSFMGNAGEARFRAAAASRTLLRTSLPTKLDSARQTSVLPTRSEHTSLSTPACLDMSYLAATETAPGATGTMPSSPAVNMPRSASSCAFSRRSCTACSTGSATCRSVGRVAG